MYLKGWYNHPSSQLKGWSDRYSVLTPRLVTEWVYSLTRKSACSKICVNKRQQLYLQIHSTKANRWFLCVDQTASSRTQSRGLAESECQSGWQRQSHLHAARPASVHSAESRLHAPEEVLFILSSWKTSLQGCDLSCWQRLWPLHHIVC